MEKVCQSCGMPIKEESQLALEADGSKSVYCIMCYKDGKFLEPDITLKEMKQKCIDIMKEEMNVPKFMGKLFTKDLGKLERWKENK